MKKIDEILEMLSCDNPKEVQDKGVELGKQVQTLECFIMPYDKNGSEKLWGNCSKIVLNRRIESMRPYFGDLLKWIRDLEKPGALEIYDYLLSSSIKVYEESLEFSLRYELQYSLMLGDKMYHQNLLKLREEIIKNGVNHND